MGEAKWRATNDPTFGKIPKNGSIFPERGDGSGAPRALQPDRLDWEEIAGLKAGGSRSIRGVVISVPMRIEGGNLSAKGGLDPQELRNSLLFWDKLVWPDSNVISIQGNPDANYLQEAGILTRPRLVFAGSGAMSEITARLHVQAFDELERVAPGAWALATGERSFLWDGLPEGNARSGALELYRAVPVPDADVPLAEVLEFRHRRNDEAMRLRDEIDSLTAKLSVSAEPNAELERSKQQVQDACADLLKAGMDWKFPIRISDLKCSFDVNPGQIVTAVAGGAWVGAQMAMPTIAALVGGALSVIKITGDVRRQAIRPRSTPYQYVYSFHKDLF